MRFISSLPTPSVARILLLFLVFPTDGVFGQEGDEAPRISVSLRFGLTLSTVRFQDPNAETQTELRPGFHVGAGARVAVGRYAEAEGLLLYSQGGFGGRGGHPASLRTGFLELPLLVRGRFPWQVSPHLVVGVAPRLRVHCSLSEVGLVQEAGCDDPVVGTGWRRFDLAAIAGLGVGAKLGARRLLVEGLLQWGIVDVKSHPLPPGWAKNADLRLSTVLHLPYGGNR